MIIDIPESEARSLAKTHSCGECGGRLSVAWGGSFGVDGYILRCGLDIDHATIKRPGTTRQLYDPDRGLIEVDILTQQEVGATTELAPMTAASMEIRVDMAIQAKQIYGDLYRGLSPEVKRALVEMALAYGLNPMLGELAVLHDKPFPTIRAVRRKQTEAGHHPSISFRFPSAEERTEYERLGALQPGDLVRICILTTEWGNTVQGFGKVTVRQMTDLANDKKSLRNPVLADNPIEMVEKRAEARARDMAYGGLGMPTVLELTEPVIDAEVRELPSAPVTAKNTLRECHLHLVNGRPTRMGKRPDGTYAHKDGQGWCNGVPFDEARTIETPTAINTGNNIPDAEQDTPEDTPEDTLEDLKSWIVSENWDWGRFQDLVLHMTWDEWLQLTRPTPGEGRLETAIANAQNCFREVLAKVGVDDA